MSDNIDKWCVMCGAAPDEPCTTISGDEAGSTRPLPHFYRGSDERPAVPVKDEPPRWTHA